jgi:hypothetical protein
MIAAEDLLVLAADLDDSDHRVREKAIQDVLAAGGFTSWPIEVRS